MIVQDSVKEIQIGLIIASYLSMDIYELPIEIANSYPLVELYIERKLFIFHFKFVNQPWDSQINHEIP